MHISANKVPIKENDTNTFWGPSPKDGRSQSQFPIQSQFLSHSHCQGSLALVSFQFVLQPGFCLFLSPVFYFSLSPTSHHMLQPHLSICRYRSGSSSLLPHCICLCVCVVPLAWSLGIPFLSFKIHSVYIQINDINLNTTDNVELLK